jgi:hypothetical protein
LRYRGADNRSGGKKTAEGMEVVFGEPDRSKPKLFPIYRLLDYGAQAPASVLPRNRKR